MRRRWMPLSLTLLVAIAAETFAVDHKNLIPLANSGSRCAVPHQGDERRLSGFGRAMVPQPCGHPGKIDRRGREDMLEVRLRHPDVACMAYPIAADSVGDGALNPSSLRILYLIHFSLLTSSCRL